jgi:hypothetical protein
MYSIDEVQYAEKAAKNDTTKICKNIPQVSEINVSVKIFVVLVLACGLLNLFMI